LSCAEAVHAFARMAFAAAQHALPGAPGAPPNTYKLTSDWYSPICACGVSSWWELRWKNYGSYWDLRWRHQRGQAGAPAPDARLTVAVAVRSAERHHDAHGAERHDGPRDDDIF
jgi:hypothetical protein